MKKLFQAIGIITLLIGSFAYSEEVATTGKQTDKLLNIIEEKQSDYKTNPIEAIITQDTIIPGKNGQMIDVDKSYANMLQIGYFNAHLLEYKKIYIKNQLKENKDKYIISTFPDNNITLIFKVGDTDDINSIIKILDKHQIKATFYITTKYLENNYNQVVELIKKGHTIGNLSNNENYSDPSFRWAKSIITGTKNQKYNFCYAKEKNKDILKACYLNNSYTIMPTSIITTSPLLNIKHNLKKGALISLNINKELENELENIINYIKSKGYNINPLEKLLKE